MTTLLQPFVVESCQNTLRDRRRSSIRSLNPVTRLFSTSSVVQDGSAIVDECPAPDGTSHAVSHAVSRPSDAHISEYSLNIRIPRHHDTLSTLGKNDPISNSSSPDSCKGSFLDIGPTLPNPSPKMERMKWRLASTFFVYFLCGWGDGVTGTVLPYFQAEFHLSSMKSSLLFAGSTCGFAIGTLVVESVMNYLGRIPLHHKGPFASNGSSAYGYSASRARHLTLILGSVLHACFFIIMGSRGGFPALFMAYVVAAFARAFLTACLNSYCALKGKQVIGYAFGLWSFGGVISPLVCQSVISTGVPWFQFYFGSLVLSGINAAFLGCTFKPTMKESTDDHQQAMDEAFPPEQSPSGSCTPTDYFSKGSPQLDNGSKPNDSLRRALSMRYQWAFSLFAWLYCGSETTTQGFMVLYLLAARNANPKTVGYVTSGFWGGITVGRFLWGYFSPSLTFTQKKYLVHGSISVALVMHLLIWFVNSNIENAFSTSIIGLLYGPIFPACLDLATSILPPDVHMVAMALISSFASLGSAMFPFMAGSIASVKGIQSMTYVTVPQAAVMVTIWFFFPSKIPGRNV